MDISLNYPCDVDTKPLIYNIISQPVIWHLKGKKTLNSNFSRNRVISIQISV